ncbi:glycosyltransferase family 4 protein [Labilibaculum manganireducens]|nr:glycosyltransferase family 4 protein [Labilibaculum manganireducens]
MNTIDEAVLAVDSIKWVSRAYCKEWAESKFTQEKMIEAYLDVYRKILE